MANIEINGKSYELKEIGYIEALELEGLDKSAISKKMLSLSAGLSEEDISKLTLKEGAALQRAINEINTIEELDFPNPSEEKTN